MFSCEFCEISKNTFSRRIPLVAASVSSEKIPQPTLRVIRTYKNHPDMSAFRKYIETAPILLCNTVENEDTIKKLRKLNATQEK